MSGNMRERLRRAGDKVVKVLSGDLLLEKRIDRQLPFVAYIFVLVILFITWNLTVESKLSKVQDNEKVLEELRISYQQRTLDLVGMNNRTKIDHMLSGCSSTLHSPKNPPRRIEVKKSAPDKRQTQTETDEG